MINHSLAELKSAPEASSRAYLAKESFLRIRNNVMEVINIVSTLKNKNSSGFDNIPVNLMKSSICCIAEPVSAIINCSLNTGVFPDTLKIVKVCAVFLKTVKKVTFKITGQFLSCPVSQKHLEKMYIIGYCLIWIRIIFSALTNMVSGKIIPHTWP